METMVKCFFFLLLAAPVFAGVLFLLKIRRIRKAEKEQEIREIQKHITREQARQAAAVALAAGKRKAEQDRKNALRNKKAETEKARAERKTAREQARQAADEKRAAKLEAARLLAEYRERALAAAVELRSIETAPARSSAPADPVQPSAPVQDPEQRPETISAADPVQASAPDNAPKPFAGQIVSFTGKLRSMTRAQAAEIIRKGGGKPFSKAMPAGTTLLIVGDVQGDGNTLKLDKADEWIGQVRKIYEPQFLEMLNE